MLDTVFGPRHCLFTMTRRVLPLLAVLALASPVSAQVTFQFDYTYDDNNFFTGANASRQSFLNAAGSYVSDLISSTALAAITPDLDNTWNANIFDPRNTASSLSLGNISIAANTIVVYAGGYDLPGSTLGIGGPGGYSASGFAPWFDTLASRGNGSFSMTKHGAITFDTVTTWHFDSDITTTESFAGQSDFFTVAVHELLHLIGIGTNNTWQGLISGVSPTSTFTGTASVTANGGPVLLDPGEGHWVDGTNSFIYGTATAQETVMDPSITIGTRKYITNLDAAALTDLGYSVTAIPEPSTYAALIGCVALVVAYRRRRAA